MNVTDPTTTISRRPHRDPRRSGSVYVLVLATALAVTVIGLSAITVARVERDAYSGAGDRVLARYLARTGIEMALYEIDADPSWRTAKSAGLWITNRPIAGGTYSVSVDDPANGVLSDDDTEPILVTGVGRYGPAEYQIEVQLEPVQQPLTCLDLAWCSGNDLIFSAGAVMTADRALGANNAAIAEPSATINADVEAVNTISGTGYTQSTTTGVDPRTLPDPDTVFDYYVANGTAISVASLNFSNGAYVLEDVVLGPTVNPYGPVNPQGIYVIDCQGADLHIRRVRIVGTIVLLNAGDGSMVYDEILWEPAVANFPALMVQGNMKLSPANGASLDESTVGTNFNPLSLPFLGEADEVLDDAYPTTMSGLIFATGGITTSAAPVLSGVLISLNTSTIAGSVNVTYDGTYLSNPPPGFYEIPKMKVVTGSFRRSVD